MTPRALAVLAAALPGGMALAPISASADVTLSATIQSNGSNISSTAAQNIDFAIDSDTVLQNASSFAGGQPVSPQFFPYGLSPVTVNLNLTVLGNLTAPGTPASTDYFSFNEAPGAPIGLYATATSPPGQGTQLLLFDNNGNLVAVADGNAPDGLSSEIQYTGGAGTWVTEVTQGSSTTLPIDYKLQFAITTTATFTTNVVGSGKEEGGSLGLYDIDANAGDQLSIGVQATTPSTATELLLFDNHGNLVAVAEGNGPDGFSSIIDYTASSSGVWQVEVAPADGAYAYDLNIEGASGFGPVNPTAVPEASTWAALMVGLAGLALVARGRRARVGLRDGRPAQPHAR